MDVPAAVFPTLPAATRFAFIINGLIAAIGARFADRERWSADLILYVWDRVIRINQTFQRLAARIQMGKLPKERDYRPRQPTDPMDTPPPSPPDPPANPDGREEKPGKPRPGGPMRPWLWKEFPQGQFGWLCGVMPSNRFLPGADVAALDLRALMEDPEMRALLAATPRMRQLLRPLFWMLGLPTSLLGAFPPRPRRKRPWRPAGPSKTDIMAMINDRPGPIHGRGGPPFLPGESPRGGFQARLARARRGKPWDFLESD